MGGTVTDHCERRELLRRLLKEKLNEITGASEKPQEAPETASDGEPQVSVPRPLKSAVKGLGWPE